MEQNFVYDEHKNIVSTTQGKVRGYQYRGMHIFKGIPYAEARRFHKPEPVKPWDHVLDATNYGYVCPLMSIDKPEGELKVPHRYWPMNENCQNLNIWTPGLDGEKRPVLVWLHGGGFFAGSSIEQIAYEGENMCLAGDVVVVSINHRLNILGYTDLSDFGMEYENSGNAGGDDIIAALSWIHDNILNFGGDPENVTVFGQSGGGVKVTTLLQSPEADGLIARGIIMSGVIRSILEDSKGSGKELVDAIMERLGKKDVHELETIPYEQLAAAYREISPAIQKAGGYIGGTPHPSDQYLGDPLKTDFRKETANIPLLIGTVTGEFAGFFPGKYDKNAMNNETQELIIRKELGDNNADVLIPLFRKAYPERKLLDLLSVDFIFRAPTIEYIRKRSALNASTYAYLFNLDQPVDGGTIPWHCSDIPFVFHNTQLVPSTQNPGVTERLEKQIFDSVIAFARTGDPSNSSVPHWNNSTPQREYTMVFGENTELRENYDHELIVELEKRMGPYYQKIMSDIQIQH